MSLNKSISLTVNDYDIKLSSNIKFYQNDQLKLKFEINEYGINVENGVKVRASMPVTPLSAILFIETPLGVDSIESTVIENNAVTFYLSSTHTQHVGISRMQIQLSDEDGCQVTLPPFQFEIRENIYDGEVVLNQVLLADEDNNILVDENGNGLNIGTQVSSQTYAVALSADETKTATSSIPTKQIQDYDLKIGVKGTEDLLIQDNGITKRMKTSELMDAVTIDVSIYYTKEEINTLLENKADVSHTHVVADITDLSIPIIDVDKAYVDTQLETKANVADIPSLDGYATEVFVTNKIAEASLGGGEVDLSGLATKDELNSSLATKSDVGHTHEQYLTEHQDISMKADKTELHSHTNKTVLDGITSTKVTEWNNKSNFDGNYNSLTNKPTIPTVDVDKNYVDTQLSTKANISDIPSLEGYATETYVKNKIAEASLSGGEVDLSSYATKDELTVGLAKKSNVEHIHSYNDLTNKPTIPSVEGLASTEYVDNAVSNITIDTSNLATKDELNAKANSVHTHISSNITGLSIVATTGDYNDLLNKPNVTNGKDGENGATFTPNVDIDGNLSWINDKGLINPSPINIKGAKGDKGEKGETGQNGLDGLTTSISLNGSTYTHINGTITLPNYPTVPTSTSQLTNDSGFLTSVPNEYITETELNIVLSTKANISDIPSLEGYATETYVNNKIIPKLVGNTVTDKTLTLTVDKYQYAVLSNGDSINLPSVSSFTEIHLFFKADTDLTLTFPSVRWQSIPSITSGHTYEIIFTYVVDEWLAGVICYE